MSVIEKVKQEFVVKTKSLNLNPEEEKVVLQSLDSFSEHIERRVAGRGKDFVPDESFVKTFMTNLIRYKTWEANPEDIKLVVNLKKLSNLV